MCIALCRWWYAKHTAVLQIKQYSTVILGGGVVVVVWMCGPLSPASEEYRVHRPTEEATCSTELLEYV